MRTKIILATACASALASGAAYADPLKGVVYAGGVVSEDPSGYIGVTHALPGATLGHGFAVKAAGGGGAYRYDSGGNQIKGRYYSGSAGLVYQHSGEWGWANVGAGARVTDTTLTPDDPGNERQGTRVDAVVSTDGALNPQGLRLSWYGEYGVRDKSYGAKVQVTHPVAENWRVGAEGLFQGDESYDRQGAGLVIAAKVRKNLEMQISGGYTFQSGRGEEPYVSFSLSQLF